MEAVLFGFGTTVGGGLLLAVGLLLGRRTARLWRHGVRADAVGIGTDRGCPVVRFVGPAGPRSAVLDWGNGLLPGHRLTVVYDPADPDTVTAASVVHLWLVPAAAVLTALPLLSAGLWAWAGLLRAV